ncbi:acetyl-CoA carboxylase biotin carboxylase subunit [Gluconobacter potus]|uniref:acetyl-CoA carboxylase biotin carboxylase subunit n=1 Tax=Gluconobacter potus TaxID=2724927 RepID=UPI0039E7EC75
MINTILIANRGEIAVRIIRTCREMGIKTVAVYSSVDANAMHVKFADVAICIGPPAANLSYLNIPAILAAAVVSGADAIHPGYGFLSENAHFAEIVEDHGLIFIGPRAEHIRAMGDKIQAKAIMKKYGVPTVPGSDGALSEMSDALKLAEDIGYPVLIKASAGGGGRGMKVAYSSEELAEAVRLAQIEASAAFGNSSVYLEKYLRAPRHIELQIVADRFGSVVHFGERDCSLQRRHQKLIEEAGSPVLLPCERDRIGGIVTNALAEIGYQNIGTMEFLYEDDNFYFIEMNTRLQVEHPVTELICGVDLVREQIRIADGHALSYPQKMIHYTGNAIECRITAEDPATFTPSPGKVDDFHQPGGLGVRMDTALYSGYVVPPQYDSMIGKLIVHGRDRSEAIMRMTRALDEVRIDGIKTVIPLLRDVMRSDEFRSGAYNIHWLEKFVDDRLMRVK